MISSILDHASHSQEVPSLSTFPPSHASTQYWKQEKSVRLASQFLKVKYTSSSGPAILSARAKFLRSMNAKAPAQVEDHLVAGLVAGAVSSALLLPLDLIKVHLQVYDRAGRPFPSMYKGMQSIVQQEGYRGLYKGLTPALLANGLSWGGYFYFYEHAKNRYLRQHRQITSVHHLLSAFEAGIIMVFLTNPLWLIKTRMQLQPGGASALESMTKAVTNPIVASTASHLGKQIAYTGVTQALRTIVREEGVLGLYKGILPALLLTSHGAIQFVTYEWLKKVVEPYQAPVFSFSVLGGMAKILAGLVTYPPQVVKARLQQRDTGASRWRYTSTWDCVLKIWRFEGLLGFFKGCLPNVLKTAPSAVITFLVYEQCVFSFNVLRGKPQGGVDAKTPEDIPENSADEKAANGVRNRGSRQISPKRENRD